MNTVINLITLITLHEKSVVFKLKLIQCPTSLHSPYSQMCVPWRPQAQPDLTFYRASRTTSLTPIPRMAFVDCVHYSWCSGSVKACDNKIRVVGDRGTTWNYYGNRQANDPQRLCVTVSLRKRLGFINGDVVSRMGVKVLQEGQLASHYYELHIMWFVQHAPTDAKLRLGWVNLKKRTPKRIRLHYCVR